MARYWVTIVVVVVLCIAAVLALHCYFAKNRDRIMANVDYERRGGTADSLKSTSTTTTATAATTTTINTNTGTFPSGNIADIEVVDMNMSPHLTADSDNQMTSNIPTPGSDALATAMPLVAASSFVIGEMMRGTSPSLSNDTRTRTRTRSNSKHRSVCGTMIEIKTPSIPQSDEDEDVSPRSDRNVTFGDEHDRKDGSDDDELKHDTLNEIKHRDVNHTAHITSNLSLAKWSGILVALKRVSPDEFQSTLTVPRHSNVVHVHGFISNAMHRTPDANLNVNGKVNAESSGLHPKLVIDYMAGGSAVSHLYASHRQHNEHLKEPPSASEICLVLKGAANGLFHVHESGLLHRSVCGSNILLGKMESHRVEQDTEVRICNVGQRGVKNGNEVSRDIKWRAPEVLREGFDAHSQSSDVYSFGITMWELCCGMQPYSGISATEVAIQVVEGLRPDLSSQNRIAQMPAGYETLMKRCWSANAQDRPTFQQIVTELESMVKQCSDTNTLSD